MDLEQRHLPTELVPEHCFVCCYAWVLSLVRFHSQQHGHASQDGLLWLELSHSRRPRLNFRRPLHSLEPSWPTLTPPSCSPTRPVRQSRPTRSHCLTHCRADMQAAAYHHEHANILVGHFDLRQALGAGVRVAPERSQYLGRTGRHSRFVRWRGLLPELQVVRPQVAHGSWV